jgi:alpha-1,6-mannosyltransferase
MIGDYRQFLRGREGRSALLGLMGTVLVTVGSFGAGATRVHDRPLEAAHLSWLRYGHGLSLATTLFWVGVAILVIAWIRLGRAALAGRLRALDVGGTVALWSVPLLIAVPLYSRDAYSYLAQGALLRDGFDPYAVGPVADPSPLLDDVSSVWTTTTAPYGPLALLIGRVVTTIFGDDVMGGTIGLRIAFLPGLALIVWGVAALAKHFGANPAVSLWFAVLNPLVVLHLVGGVHNESLMVGFMVAGLALVLRGRHVSGVALITAGTAVKATAGLALPFVVWIWYHHRRAAADGDSPATGSSASRLAPVLDFVQVAVRTGAVFVAVFAVFSAIAWVGLGWLTAAAGSTKIINYLTLPTIAAHVLSILAWPFVGTVFLAPILAVARTAAMALLGVVLVVTWWRYRQNDYRNVQGVLICLIAMCVLYAAALPWYYTWPLAVAGAFTLGRRALAFITMCSVWLLGAFLPNGGITMYSIGTTALVLAVAALATVSLFQPDPLKLRPRLGLEPAVA